MIRREMQQREIHINFVPMPSVKDKATRARPLQKRMKAQKTRFNTLSDWFADYKAELLRFTSRGQAVHDDRVDSSSLLIRGLDTLAKVELEDFLDEEEQYMQARAHSRKYDDGRSRVTGY